jgi:hypothetical protein
MSKSLKIFLAHASEDKEQIRDLYRKLKDSGFDPWLDEFDLIPGQNWQIEIPRAIRQSDIFVACLSTRSVEKRGYVQKEFRLALSAYAEKPAEGIYLIPLRLDDCIVPDLQIPEFGARLRDIQWLDYWKPDGFGQLLRAIGTATDSKRIQHGWELNFKAPIFGIKALAVYNNKLYACGQDDPQFNGRLYVFDGTTWMDTNFDSAVGVKVDFMESLQVFNNRLYIGTRVDVGGRTFARVYHYDGTTFVLDLSQSGQPGYSGIEDLAVHGNTLYAANGSTISEVYQRNADNNWTTLGDKVELGSPVRALASYNNILFAGTGGPGNQPKVWRWAINRWELVKDLKDGEFALHQDSVFSLVSAYGKLYVGLIGPGNNSPVFAYNGTNWIIARRIYGCQTARLAIIANNLWVGTDTGRVFCFDGLNWEEQDSISRGFGIRDFAQYGEFVYASTIGYGGIYRLRLKGEI